MDSRCGRLAAGVAVYSSGVARDKRDREIEKEKKEDIKHKEKTVAQISTRPNLLRKREKKGKRGKKKIKKASRPSGSGSRNILHQFYPKIISHKYALVKSLHALKFRYMYDPRPIALIRGAEHLEDLEQLVALEWDVFLRIELRLLALEDWAQARELGEHTAHGPAVDYLGIVLRAHQAPARGTRSSRRPCRRRRAAAGGRR